MQLLIAHLCKLQLLLNLLQFQLQEVYQLFVGLVYAFMVLTEDFSVSIFLREVLLLSFKILSLLFKFLYHFLTKMGSLGKLFLDIFMHLDISFYFLDVCPQLVVCCKKFLSLLALVIEFSR